MSAVATPAVPVTPQVAPPPPVPPVAAVPPALSPEPDLTITDIRRFAVDKYMTMIEVGILIPHDHGELVEGWVVQNVPPNPPHNVVASNCVRYQNRNLFDGWVCRPKSPTRTDTSRPEPDASVVRGHDFDDLDRDPTPTDTALLIEVSDGSSPRGLGTKVRLYGRTGCGVYWILNDVEMIVEFTPIPPGPPTPRATVKVASTNRMNSCRSSSTASTSPASPSANSCREATP